MRGIKDLTQETLPKVRGRYSYDVTLSKITWFRVGGAAQVVFKPADVDDLQDFLKNLHQDIPVFVMGVGSNLLVRDGGIKGVVVRLGRGFTHIDVDDSTMTVGASALDINVAKMAARHALTGLEFFSGIPGTIGGALRMNAGAYGRQTCDGFVKGYGVDRQGVMHEINKDEMGFSYRATCAPQDWIFTKAIFKAQKGNALEIKQKMDAIKQSRQGSQPIRSRTGGSTFRNPQGHKAWQLIDKAGLRGFCIGDAQVSEQHCNFMINKGAALARDLEALGEHVRHKVLEQSGIDLHWEIKKVGQK